RRLAPLVSWPLAAAVRVLDPVTPVLTFVSRVAQRTFWPHVRSEPYLHAEDLERAIEASHLREEVVRQEREVLHKILDLSEITAEEIMRPRGPYVVLPAPVGLADLKGEVPPGDCVLVQSAEDDDFSGVVLLSEFASLTEQGLERAADPLVYVPWCANLAETLRLLRAESTDVAVVVNEHGETIGIVTFDDIMESMLLPQASRARRLLRREPLLAVDDGRWHADGLTTLRYLSQRLGIDYDPDSEPVFTVAGILQEKLEHVPEVGDECTWRGYRLKVIEAGARGRLRVALWRDSDSTQPHGPNTV
ncbi:MAG: CBS domain-containing protein, partial [Planctomycetes bacterium]|nr:CBS domain-containing protein [Planctomycetota bacterium]